MPYKKGKLFIQCKLLLSTMEGLHSRQMSSYVSRVKCQDIMEYTGCSKIDLQKCLNDNPAIERLSDDELKFRLRCLNELPFVDNNTIKSLRLVKHHPITIKHRFLVLKECGILPDKLTTSKILRYFIIVKTNIEDLKKRKFIPDDFDVTSNLCLIADLKRELFPEFQDHKNPSVIKIAIMKRYLVQHMDFPNDVKTDKLVNARLKHKSIQETIRTLQILQDKIGFTKEKLKNNFFLTFSCNADNLLELLKIYPTLAGIEVRELVMSHPKILASSVANISSIYEQLQQFGISDESISKCPEIFTLNSETVAERLSDIKENSFLSVRRHHPRLLELVMYYNKARERIKILENMKVPYVSLNMLASTDSYFQRFCELGFERHHGRDILYFLKTELCCSKKELKEKFDKHPYWAFSSLVNINTNLNLLKSLGYNNQEILKDVYILLYPSQRVIDEMKKLKDRQDLDSCKDASGNIRKDCLLSLVLYYLEKEINFSGGGIWDKEISYPQPLHITDKFQSTSIKIEE